MSIGIEYWVTEVNIQRMKLCGMTCSNISFQSRRYFSSVSEEECSLIIVVRKEEGFSSLNGINALMRLSEGVRE